jgi:MoxR-like ATPase
MDSSSIDRSDAILKSIASGANTIFECSLGQGKTAVAFSVLTAIGMKCIRINLSPTTSVEDLFGREVPQSSTGEFSTRFVEGPLTLAMRRSQMDKPNDHMPSQAILFDEINLASPQVLELLEVFMLNMNSSSRYFLPNGKEIFHNPIVIVATMNSSALSNARSSLSTKLQGASHFLRLIPFNEYELEALADSILCNNGENLTSSSFISKIMTAHFTAAKLHELETNSSSE